MRALRPGEGTLLSWRGGAVECRVVAAAGSYVLLRPTRITLAPVGACSLSTLDGEPFGWDGDVDLAAHPHELRFRVSDAGRPADRRAAVRVPVAAPVEVRAADGTFADAELVDVSAGGMRFRRPGRLPAGTTVRVHAELPDGPVIDAEAVVRVCGSDDCAVEYTEMLGASRADVGAWTVDVLRAGLAA